MQLTKAGQCANNSAVLWLTKPTVNGVPPCLYLYKYNAKIASAALALQKVCVTSHQATEVDCKDYFTRAELCPAMNSMKGNTKLQFKFCVLLFLHSVPICVHC